MNLAERVRHAKRAILAAGFQSGRFKPNGAVLRVDVLVPIAFDDFTIDEEQLVEHVRQAIRSSPDVQASLTAAELERLAHARASVASTTPYRREQPGVAGAPEGEPLYRSLEDAEDDIVAVPRPLDLRTREGRDWKAAQEQARRAGATV